MVAVGILPAVATMVDSMRLGGHPCRWFIATAGTYVSWGLLLAGWNG
jgi:hypothetical protein